jgi:hypothetical protein
VQGIVLAGKTGSVDLIPYNGTLVVIAALHGEGVPPVIAHRNISGGFSCTDSHPFP